MSATSLDPRRAAGGFAAIAAVFILVVLAIFGATVASVFSAQQRGAAMDAQGTQVYNAARTGLDVASYNAINGACGNNTFAVAGYTVSTSCTSSTHTEAGVTTTIFRITSTACNRAACPGAPGDTYVERQLRAVVNS